MGIALQHSAAHQSFWPRRCWRIITTPAVWTGGDWGFSSLRCWLERSVNETCWTIQSLHTQKEVFPPFHSYFCLYSQLYINIDGMRRVQCLVEVTFHDQSRCHFSAHNYTISIIIYNYNNKHSPATLSGTHNFMAAANCIQAWSRWTAEN